MRVIEPPKHLELPCTGFGNGMGGCYARLEIQRDDLRYWKGCNAETWGGSDPAVMFKCPVCKAVTDVPNKDWPQQLNTLTPATTAWINERPERETDK